MGKKQKTIQKEVSLSGVGLHTGNTVKMTFKPAPANHGFAFVRVDLEGTPTVEAKAEYVVNTQRGTNLEKEWCSNSNIRTCLSSSCWFRY